MLKYENNSEITDLIFDLQDCPAISEQSILRLTDFLVALKAYSENISFSPRAEEKDLKLLTQKDILGYVQDKIIPALAEFIKSLKLSESKEIKECGKKIKIFIKSSVSDDILNEIQFDKLIQIDNVRLHREAISEDKFVSLYLAKNGEVAIKCFDKAHAQILQAQLGEAQSLGKLNPTFVQDKSQFQYNPNGLTPIVYQGSPQILFFPAYRAGGGEVAVNLVVPDIRQSLIELLGGMKETGDSNVEGLFRCYKQKNQDATLYFDPKHEVFVKSFTNLRINLGNDGKTYKSAEIKRLPEEFVEQNNLQQLAERLNGLGVRVQGSEEVKNFSTTA